MVEQKQYKIPILFVIFNRVDIAKKAFAQIKNICPQVLYIACDGARNDKDGEAELVKNTREAILSEIDWQCDVRTLFQEKNLGCGKGVFTAIDWFFSNVEYGIVLEDDCIANESFFQFMAELLPRYQYDQRIGMVAGTNPIKLQGYPYSYLFSRYKSCWGWGSWKRAWAHMDLTMKWRQEDPESILANAGYRGKDLSGWKYKLKCIDCDYVSAWDWQWYFALSAQNQLCIYPRVNLISNIGNDEHATHTSWAQITIPSCNLETPLVPPIYVVPYEPFEKAFYRDANTLYIRLSRRIPLRIKNILKKTIKLLKR